MVTVKSVLSTITAVVADRNLITPREAIKKLEEVAECQSQSE